MVDTVDMLPDIDPSLGLYGPVDDSCADLRDVAADAVAVVRADAPTDDVRANLRDVAADADARHAGADRLELVRYVARARRPRRLSRRRRPG
jgi:hypothetical protein